MEVVPERPVLVDKYLDRADELDVDALAGAGGGVEPVAGWLQSGCWLGSDGCRRWLNLPQPHPLYAAPSPTHPPAADEDGNIVICGIMQHIEQAGVHSGDSACSIPPQTISEECLATIREWTPRLAKALKVVGLINIQYAVQDNQVRLGGSG